MKKEATLKRKGLTKRPPIKEEVAPKTQGANQKTFDKKRGNAKTHLRQTKNQTRPLGYQR
jgi:hypothetical protein